MGGDAGKLAKSIIGGLSLRFLIVAAFMSPLLFIVGVRDQRWLSALIGLVGTPVLGWLTWRAARWSQWEPEPQPPPPPRPLPAKPAPFSDAPRLRSRVDAGQADLERLRSELDAINRSKKLTGQRLPR